MAGQDLLSFEDVLYETGLSHDFLQESPASGVGADRNVLQRLRSGVELLQGPGSDGLKTTAGWTFSRLVGVLVRRTLFLGSLRQTNTLNLHQPLC